MSATEDRELLPDLFTVTVTQTALGRCSQVHFKLASPAYHFWAVPLVAETVQLFSETVQLCDQSIHQLWPTCDIVEWYSFFLIIVFEKHWMSTLFVSSYPCISPLLDIDVFIMTPHWRNINLPFYKVSFCDDRAACSSKWVLTLLWVTVEATTELYGRINVLL